MKQEVEQKLQNYPYHQTPVCDNYIQSSIFEDAFMKVSFSHTKRAYTIIQTPAYIFNHNCPEKKDVATIVKEKTETLGTICISCGQMFKLPFEINPKIIIQIEEQTQFEDAFKPSL